MENPYEVKWLGWNNEGNSDKVWGWLEMNDGRKYCFWGRRGKTLQFKHHRHLDRLLRLEKQKETRKGYNFIRPEDYDQLVKDFLDSVEVYCMTAILSDTVR